MNIFTIFNRGRSHITAKSVAILALLIAVTMPAFAQDAIQISGRVYDKNNQPIIGATVTVKGTTVGGISGGDGEYFLTAPSEESVLTFNFFGYTTKEIVVGKQTKINVMLETGSLKLDEIVVVGYGTATKRSLSSSVTLLDPSEITDAPVTNLSQALAGRAAGLIVQGSGGGVNKKSTISIRGGGTPLVVIDGIVRNYDDFILLSPNDIKSLVVLKDAASTAVYGSRASDGILQVTTKTGSDGPLRLQYGYTFSMSQPASLPERLDSWTRADYANVSKANAGVEAAFSPETIQIMKDGSDPVSFSNTNWEELTLKNAAPTSKHDFSISGGNDVNQFYASLGYIDQESLYKSDNYNMQRTNFRLSNVGTLKSINLKTTATIDGYMQESSHPYTSSISSPGGVFQMIRNRIPFAPHVNEHGLPYNATGNIYAELFGNPGYIRKNENVINGNLSLEYSVPKVDGLKFKATGNYRFYSNAEKQWRQDPAKYNWEENSNPLYDGKPKLYHKNDTGYTYNTQFFGFYDKTFGKNAVSVLAGFEQTYGFWDSYWSSRENYDFPIDQIGVGDEASQKNGGGEGEHGRAGWIGQLKYGFDQKYFLEASVRHDGSDNFPENNRWGTFYSVSGAWSIIDEGFMQNLADKGIFNQLKARASYGQVGLDNWGTSGEAFNIGRFEYMNSYDRDNKAYVMNGAYVAGFSEGKLPSPDITWFTTDQFDVGIDFSSLNNRLYGSVDYFYYKTSGFLYAPNPIDIGYTDPIGVAYPRVSTNGEHRRAGMDFSVGWRDNIGDFSYNISANFTKFDQLWAIKPDEAIQNVMDPYKRSSQQTGFAGNYYNSLGFYQNEHDVYNNPKRLGSDNLSAGNLKYEDFNGDGKIDGSDQYRQGNSSFPRGNYGINARFGYKGISVALLFQGATSFDMYLTDGQNAQTGELPIVYDYQADYWTQSNTNSKFPILVDKSYNGSNDYVSSNYWLVNGAYLRLKEATISYDLKSSIVKKVGWLETATISFTGQNLFTISDATKYGLDPENASVEHIGYPNERTFSVSIKLGFK